MGLLFRDQLETKSFYFKIKNIQMNFSGGLNIPIADREKRKNSKNRFDPVEPYIYMQYYDSIANFLTKISQMPHFVTLKRDTNVMKPPNLIRRICHHIYPVQS